MLRRLVKIKKACTFAFIPKILSVDSRYIPKRITKRTYEAFGKIRKSTSKNYEEYEQVSINYTKTKDGNPFYLPNMAQNIAIEELHSSHIMNKETDCEKCQRLIAQEYENGSMFSKNVNTAVDNVRLKATTSKQVDEKLTQKEEQLDEPTLVEAGSIEDFNVPQILGKDMKNVKFSSKLSVDPLTIYEEVAKRCLNCPIEDIDRKLLEEMRKITKEESQSPIPIDIPINQCISNEIPIENTLNSQVNVNNSIKAENLLPLHLDKGHLPHLKFSTIDDPTVMEELIEIPIITPYDRQSFPYYEYNTGQLKEPETIIETIQEPVIDVQEAREEQGNQEIPEKANLDVPQKADLDIPQDADLEIPQKADLGIPQKAQNLEGLGVSNLGVPRTVEFDNKFKETRAVDTTENVKVDQEILQKANLNIPQKENLYLRVRNLGVPGTIEFGNEFKETRAVDATENVIVNQEISQKDLNIPHKETFQGLGLSLGMPGTIEFDNKFKETRTLDATKNPKDPKRDLDRPQKENLQGLRVNISVPGSIDFNNKFRRTLETKLYTSKNEDPSEKYPHVQGTFHHPPEYEIIPNTAISGTLPTPKGKPVEKPDTAISAQDVHEFHSISENFTREDIRSKSPLVDRIVPSKINLNEVNEPKTNLSTLNVFKAESTNEFQNKSKINFASILDKCNTKEAKLSEILQKVRERNRFEYCKDFSVKPKEEMSGPCVPPFQPGKENPPPCKPKPKEEPSKCKPRPPPCPPKKKDPCAKFTSIFSALIKEANLLQFERYCIIFDVRRNYSTVTLSDEVLEKIRRLSHLEPSFGKNFARDFDPWTPIPSWPIPKKEKARPFVCPKEGCKKPRPRPCKEEPCITFPKRTFSETSC